MTILLAALPVAYALLLVFSAGRACTDDYWGILSPLLDSDGSFLWNLDRWLLPHNRYHCITLTRVVYAANVELTHGSNRALGFFSWVMCLVRAGALLSFLKFVAPVSLRPLHVVLVSVFCFSPAASWMWFHGFGGVQWMTADAFAFSAIAILMQAGRFGWFAVSGALAAGLLAMGFFSSPIGVWPALALVSFLLPLTRNQRAAILCVGCAVVITYASWITPPSASESPHMPGEVISLIMFFFTFLGCIFTTKIEIATLVGLVGFVLSLLLFVHAARYQRERAAMAPWLAVMLYVLCNAGMAALGRNYFGAQGAVTSRYAHLPAVFWLATLILSIHVAWPFPVWGRAATGVIVGAGAALVLAMVPLGLNYVRGMRQQARLQVAAELSAQMQIPDRIALRDTVCGCVDFSNPVWSRCKFTKHIPFDRDVRLPTANGGTLGEGALGRNSLAGEMERLFRAAAHPYIRAVGWFEMDPTLVGEIESLVLADGQGRIQGMAVALDDRLTPPFVAKKRVEWIGYALARPTIEQLALFVQLKGQPGYRRAGPFREVELGSDEHPFDRIWEHGHVSIAGVYVTTIFP